MSDSLYALFKWSSDAIATEEQCWLREPHRMVLRYERVLPSDPLHQSHQSPLATFRTDLSGKNEQNSRTIVKFVKVTSLCDCSIISL